MQHLVNNKAEIILNYKNGTSMQQLAKDFNVSTWSIKKFLIDNNIKTRTLNDLRVKYNEAFFQTPSPELYYFWGFNLGDGSLTKREGDKYLTITLDKKDLSILQTFCKWLQISEDNIKYYRNNELVRLNIYSDYMKQDLSHLGIVPNKTYNPSIPQVPEKYIKPFLIGFIDADGSIAFGKKYKGDKFIRNENTLHIVNNHEIINWFVEQLKLIGFNGNINFQIKNEHTKRARIQRKEDVINLFKLLEPNNYQDFILKRKWDKVISQLFEK